MHVVRCVRRRRPGSVSAITATRSAYNLPAVQHTAAEVRVANVPSLLQPAGLRHWGNTPNEHRLPRSYLPRPERHRVSQRPMWSAPRGNRPRRAPFGGQNRYGSLPCLAPSQPAGRRSVQCRGIAQSQHSPSSRLPRASHSLTDLTFPRRSASLAQGTPRPARRHPLLSSAARLPDLAPPFSPPRSTSRHRNRHSALREHEIPRAAHSPPYRG